MAAMNLIMENACQGSPATPQRQNHILIGDDDHAFRRTLRLLLQSGGYCVLAASTGAECVEVFASRRDEIALVLLDLNMPGMVGGGALRELRRIRPDIRAVLCSGFGSGDSGDEVAGLNWSGVLEKPVEAETLLRMVRDLVSGP